MTPIKAVEDIYTMIRELIVELTKAGFCSSATILTHRMTQVAWTSSSELLDELAEVLTAIQKEHLDLPEDIVKAIQQVLQTLKTYNGAPCVPKTRSGGE